MAGWVGLEEDMHEEMVVAHVSLTIGVPRAKEGTCRRSEVEVGGRKWGKASGGGGR